MIRFLILDKIIVLMGPNSTYNVEPGMSVFIEVRATTDRLFMNQMTYKWQWYEEKTDKKTGVTVTSREIYFLSHFIKYFQMNFKQRCSDINHNRIKFYQVSFN
jgi:hypothetical protein